MECKKTKSYFYLVWGTADRIHAIGIILVGARWFEVAVFFNIREKRHVTCTMECITG